MSKSNLGMRACGVFLLWAGTAVALPAQTFTTLRDFHNGPNGGVPRGKLALDAAGNVYGTTLRGGYNDNGVVFKLDQAGVETVLYTFTRDGHGYSPVSGVIRDPKGNLYGTTDFGGNKDCAPPLQGCGVVFKLNTAGRYTVLHAFRGGTDGIGPSGLIRDGAGNLYGTCGGGGIYGGNGVVFKVDGAKNETVLYSFSGGPHGRDPTNGVILDASGNLYGTTIYGGNTNCGSFGSGCGVVFKLDTSGNETVLYTFNGGADGATPTGLIGDSAGNLYGTTFDGGTYGYGTVFKLDSTGAKTTLYSFMGKADGGYPSGPNLMDGNIYGTTCEGGTYGDNGVVFEVDMNGNETVLHDFTHGRDGGCPQSGVIHDAAGNLYGTTSNGGTPAKHGTVFKLTP
jgi:uncharacterized repeat protein (TIGR03803 family)